MHDVEFLRRLQQKDKGEESYIFEDVFKDSTSRIKWQKVVRKKGDNILSSCDNILFCFAVLFNGIL